jgi:2-amino-4-hydroxy-6-hydroxymethyldihydropteridine diphosphokinase
MIYLLTGSNLGDSVRNLELARQQVQLLAGKVVRVSKVYMSDAWGYESHNRFHNQALELESALPPPELLATLKDIEAAMGREAANGSTYQDRVIDIDILIYDDVLMLTDSLVIPHPLLVERAFALTPLDELAPGLVIPGTGLTVRECINRLAAAHG